jgi:acetyl-CoA C-acetyltransferase
VLVGVGQVVRRPTSVEDCPEPADLMAEAARAAGTDSGAGDRLLSRADSVQVVELMSQRYANAPLALAGRIGASPRETVRSTVGGNSPQMLVNRAAEDILAGRADVVVIAGAEAIHSRHLAHRTGAALPWSGDDEAAPPPDRVVGIDRPGTSEAEQARSLHMPVQIYPVFETALRVAAGETIADHQVKVSELWATFSEVATANPHAWDRRRHTAEEIRTPGPHNRWIGWPYTKLMVAYAGVDMAAALVLTSVEAAQAAGVPADRWVFPWSGSDCHDHWFVSERQDLCSSPAMAANGRAALGLAGVGIDDVAHVDLYSCFPSAVQMGAAALGLGTDRRLTVTGGLTFAGGPLNDYVTHSIASMADVLRRDPGSVGIVTALGWYATKHSIGVYSTEPPRRAFRRAEPQDEVDRTPARAEAVGYAGPVTVEAWSVMHERDGAPTVGFVSCLTPDGGRTWGNVHEAAVLRSLTVDDIAGDKGTLRDDGTLEL